VLAKTFHHLEHRLTNVHHAALSNIVLGFNPVPYGYIIQQIRKHTHGVTILVHSQLFFQGRKTSARSVVDIKYLLEFSQQLYYVNLLSDIQRVAIEISPRMVHVSLQV